MTKQMNGQVDVIAGGQENMTLNCDPMNVITTSVIMALKHLMGSIKMVQGFVTFGQCFRFESVRIIFISSNN